MKKIGLTASTALTVGNMVGSGIFLLPASLALYGGISLLGWVFAAIGAFSLAVVFKGLAAEFPNVHGGPYAYTQKVFGDFAAFIVGWGYWISIWCTNAAIAVAFVGYLGLFIPEVVEQKILSILTGVIVIWLCSAVNFSSLLMISRLQKWITILKITPILAVICIGVWYVDWQMINLNNLSDTNLFQSITTTTTLALFAFLGLESATINSNSTRDSAKTVGKAGVLAMSITTLLYLSSSVVIFGLLPMSTLQESTAPFADASAVFMGNTAQYIIGIMALIVTLGALNGWILIQGQVPLAMVNDELFPSFFGRKNKKNAPYLGIIISSFLASIVLIFRYSDSLIQVFSFMMNLSTLSVLTPFIMSILSLALCLSNQNKVSCSHNILIGFSLLFCIWMIYGVGLEVFLYGMGLIGIGIILYLIFKTSKR